MKKQLKLFLFIFISHISINLSAQHTNVQIGSSISFGEPTEPSISINPSNTDEIVIGAMTDHYYTSVDGGYSWQYGTLTSTYGVMADPVIVAGNNGNFYYIHLIPSMDRVLCQKKDDINSSWSNGSYTGLNGTMEVDKEWAAYDPGTGNLYISWTEFDIWASTNPGDSSYIYFSGSQDGGLTWGEHKLISNRGGNATGGISSVHGSMPAVGPNGEIYVCWWSRNGIKFDKSTDFGETWLSEDIEVTRPVYWIYNIPQIELGVSFANIACDRSGGPNDGTIYINWADRDNGNSDIWLVKSVDGGLSWTDPILVNNDLSGKHQFFNSMALDQVTGNLYIVFYDRRNYDDANTDVYMAMSDNGGESFSNFKISETPFYPYETVFIGHYIGVSAHDSKIFATWPRMDDGHLSLWGANIDTAMIGIDIPEVLPFSLDQNFPNPFNETTFISFKINEPSKISLKIYDVYGKEVAKLIDNQLYDRGKYVKQFDTDNFQTRSGVYYFSLIMKDKVLTRKMILIK
ncbi:T9SS type A sorting domain-containing protein [Bacteroidota bacterium]